MRNFSYEVLRRKRINTGTIVNTSIDLRTSNEEKLLFLAGELGGLLIGDENT